MFYVGKPRIESTHDEMWDEKSTGQFKTQSIKLDQKLQQDILSGVIDWKETLLENKLYV
jgi:hypothetical protein